MLSSRSEIGALLSRAGYALIALAAIAAAAVALMLPDDRSRAERPALALTSARDSDFGLQTSASGDPILSAPSLVPGSTATGTITIRNTGTQTMTLRLIRRRLADVPGPNGGKLSDALHVQIIHIRGRRKANKPRTAYTGPIARTRLIRLRKLKPKTKRTYEFVVKMADTGIPDSPSSGDNAFQGASASVDYVWRGRSQG